MGQPFSFFGDFNCLLMHINVKKGGYVHQNGRFYAHTGRFYAHTGRFKQFMCTVILLFENICV